MSGGGVSGRVNPAETTARLNPATGERAEGKRLRREAQANVLTEQDRAEAAEARVRELENALSSLIARWEAKGPLDPASELRAALASPDRTSGADVSERIFRGRAGHRARWVLLTTKEAEDAKAVGWETEELTPAQPIRDEAQSDLAFPCDCDEEDATCLAHRILALLSAEEVGSPSET